MIAVDTNVLVRLLTFDDPSQGERARHLFASNRIFVPKTVLLETEWVLRSLYGFQSGPVAEALRGLLSLENLDCEDVDSVLLALDWVELGLEFADALHLAGSRPVGRFATFDEKLRKRAGTLSAVETLKP
jgi:predicted nucleic-acid-binding protein